MATVDGLPQLGILVVVVAITTHPPRCREKDLGTSKNCHFFLDKSLKLW